MMRTTGLLVVFSLMVILYQTSAVPVASSYRLENENGLEVMEAKDKTDEPADEEKEDESDKEEEKEAKEDEEEKEDEEPKEDEEKKEDEEDTKDHEDTKGDEEKNEEKDEDEQEPDLKEEDNDDASGEESADLESDSGSGRVKDVVIENTDNEKEKPEKRSITDPRKSKVSQVQEKRCGCWGAAGEGCGCGNCCGGFDCPQVCGCGGCGGCGCCPKLNFPVTFGACVNNPCCECCQKKPPAGKCQWPCMWPCCCECDPPKFKFTPLKPKPMCHSPCHGGCCGKKSAGPARRSAVAKRCGFGCCGDDYDYDYGCGCGGGYGYGYGHGYGLHGGYGGFGPYGSFGYGPFGGYGGGYLHGGPFPYY